MGDQIVTDSFQLKPPDNYNVAIKKNRQPLSFRKKFRIYFREYCDVTGFHGFRYVAENRTVCEKILWFCAIIISLVVCTIYILEAYNTWEQSPVIVTFGNKETPIFEIPFPAITICSESKVRGNFTNLEEIWKRKLSDGNLTKKEEKYLWYFVQMCPLLVQEPELSPYELEQLDDTADFDDIFQIMQEVSPQFTIKQCQFFGLDLDCHDLFVPIITDEGICYSFNILDRSSIFKDNVEHYKDFHVAENNSEWTTDNKYEKAAGIKTYPYRAFSPGLNHKLGFDIQIRNEDVDKYCRPSMRGFRVSFHIPTRVPRLALQYVHVPFDATVMAAIQPAMITTSNLIKKYSPEKRMCYFPHEKYLKFFHVYNTNNCVLECLANITLSLCDCIPFYMPRETGTRICSAHEAESVKQIEFLYHLTKIIKEIKSEHDASYFRSIPKEQVEIISNCHCLPMCTNIEYNVGVTQTQWDWEGEIPLRDKLNNPLDYHLTRFSAYFISDNFIASERNELYGLAELLANFGGLIGLFTGFSVLSLLEIIYFLSVRLVCNVMMYKNWAGISPQS